MFWLCCWNLPEWVDLRGYDQREGTCRREGGDAVKVSRARKVVKGCCRYLGSLRLKWSLSFQVTMYLPALVGK